VLWVFSTKVLYKYKVHVCRRGIHCYIKLDPKYENRPKNYYARRVCVFVPANSKYTSIRVREDRDKCPTGGCLLSISSYKLHRLLRSYYLRDPCDCETRCVCVWKDQRIPNSQTVYVMYTRCFTCVNSNFHSLSLTFSLSNSLGVRLGNSSVSRRRQKGRSCVVLYWRQDKYRGIIIL